MNGHGARFDPRRMAGFVRSRGLFFTRLWRYAAGAVLLLGLVTQTMAIALAGGLMLAMLLVSRSWNQLTLADIEFSRSLDTNRALPGDTVILSISVTNRKPLPTSSLRIDEAVDETIVPVGYRSTLSGGTGKRIVHLTGHLRPYEKQTWTVPLHCAKRGSHPVGPASLRSGDPFGFFAARSDAADNLELLVYPRVHPLGQLELPGQRPAGEQRARTPITDSLLIRGLRDYRPEDSFRSIHWKATARLARLQVKVQEPVTTLSMMILLNLDSFEHVWEGIHIDNVELAIEVAASYANWALSERYSVGLRANGVVAGSDQPLHIPVGRGLTQQLTVMTGLARLGAYATLPFAHTVAHAIPSIPLGCTLVIITPMMSDEIATLLATAISHGRRTVLVPLGDVSPPELPGLIVREFIPLKPEGDGEVAA